MAVGVGLLSGLARAEIVVVATGGTIAGTADSATAAVGYTAARLSGEALVRAVPGIAEIDRIRCVQAMQIASESMSLEKLFALADILRGELAKDEVRGVVVTHGTDTLEETAYFLNLVLDTEKPVICIGAMRPATAYGADGPANLFDAVTVAAYPKSRGMGVMIVMNNTIHAARFAYKANTIRPDAFAASEFVALGTVVSGRVSFNARTQCRHTTTSAFRGMRLEGPIPRVDVIYCYGGIDARPLEDAVAQGAKGIVLACAGDGSLSAQMRPAVEKLAGQGYPIVRSSRIQTGPVVRNGEVRDDVVKTVPAGSINPAKSRILLTLCLMRGYDHAAITQAFEEH